MKKIMSYIEIFFLVLIMIFSFIDMPQMNNYIVLLVLSTCLFSFHECRIRYYISKLVSNLTVVSYIQNIPIYIIEKEEMGNHNVAIIMGQKNYIFAERKLMENLSESEKKAVLYHELGHINQISERSLYRLEILSGVCTSMGLYCSLYDWNVLFALGSIMMGVILLLFVQWNKVHIEYKADLYSIQKGNSKNDLISALTKIQEMNGKGKKLIMGDKDMKKRIEKIRAI